MNASGSADAAGSARLLILAMMASGGVLLALSRLVPKFGMMFSEMGIEVPWLTRLLLAGYANYLLIGLMSFAVIKEVGVRETNVRSALNMGLLIAALLIGFASMVMLLLPLSGTIETSH